MSHSVFSGSASALQTAPTKAAPRTSPNHFSFIVLQNLAMARFSSGVACLRRHSACWHAGCMASDLVHHGQSFDDQPLGFGTLAIHLGNGVDAETGAIRRPITLANTYALCPTTPRPWRLPSISNRWMWCVSWSTPVWNRTRTTRWRSASWSARTPGSAACCRSASTPIMTGTTGSFPSSM